jgi:lipoprotein-anchoring transpeptidase ErfK/SrfK
MTARVVRLVLLAAVAAATTSFPALGLEKGALPRPASVPAKAVPVTTAPAPAAPAVTAEMVNRAEQHLSAIGYCAGRSGDKAGARLAILSFQRVEGRNQTGKLDPSDVQAALLATRPVPRETGYSHIEVDLERQVLFVVDRDNGVMRALPISSGSGKLYTFEGKTSRAVTPQGRFTVYRKVEGWRKAPLGMIYYPCYFNEGWAIHGSVSVPNYPASHGCVRIPIATAKELSDITPVGTVVLIYDGPRSPTAGLPFIPSTLWGEQQPERRTVL